MGHISRIRFPFSDPAEVHAVLVAHPAFFARSSALGYTIRGASAYVFVLPQHRNGPSPHPDAEVLIEAGGIWLNALTPIPGLEARLKARFGTLEHEL